MSEKLHLYAGILWIHRLDAEVLGPLDLYRGLLIDILVINEILLEEFPWFVLPGNELCAVFAKLPLYNLLYKVDRYKIGRASCRERV